jgi:hypothetical protein
MMSEHRFSVGQSVRLMMRFPRGGPDRYEIVKLMPFDGTCFGYRIKSDEEQFFRVAKEHELSDNEPASVVSPGLPK